MVGTVHVIKCGNCGQRHATAADIRACYTQPFGPIRAGIVVPKPRAAASVRADIPGSRPNEWTLKTPRLMVENLKDGRYATKKAEDEGYKFLRITRPTSGKKKGCLIVQSQHSEAYKPCVTIYPSGSVWIADARIDMNLLIACADPMTAAMKYAEIMGVCSRCGKKLTDERSIYYGIGPECEQHWPEIINYINENKGYYYPGIVD